ncbi:MAG: undecaprenyl-diphosphate phosphatase, partial [Verrucomicrobiota bacterium]|nr:undecaprenyl-diphosphate phosphatase [Verrucomicrobiota bacterium]
MSVAHAVTLGLVEGLTEFLPVSSTGHLIITDHAFGLDSQKPLADAEGRPLWYKRPSSKNPHGEPLTLKLAADAYAVIIQFGAILAVLILYWSQIVGIARGLLGQNATGLAL